MDIEYTIPTFGLSKINSGGLQDRPLLNNKFTMYQPLSDEYTTPQFGMSSRGLGTPSLQPAQSDGGMTSAQASMISQGAGMAANLAGSIAAGVMQKRDNDAARNEARQLSGQARQDQLKQENIELGYRKKMQEQEEQQFQLQKRIQMYDQQYSIWQNAYKRELANQQKARESANKLFDMYSQADEPTRQTMIKNFI